MQKSTALSHLLAQKIATAPVHPLVQVEHTHILGEGNVKVDKSLTYNVQVWCKGVPVDALREHLQQLVTSRTISGFTEGKIEHYAGAIDRPVYNFSVAEKDLAALGIDPRNQGKHHDAHFAL